MKKKNFILEMYYEFFYRITWTKWKNLKISTILVFFCSILSSIFLYGIDIIFIFLVKNFFSL